MLNSVKSPLHPPLPLNQINEVLDMPGLNWWQISLIVLASLILIVALIFLGKFAFKKRVIEIQPADVFHEQASQLTGSSLPLNTFSEKLSLIFRQYLTERFNTPTLFKTDQEIDTHTLEQLHLEETKKEKILALLATFKEVKFIPLSENTATHPSHTPSSLVEESKALVKELEAKIISKP